VLLLLDTHSFLWWLGDDTTLGPSARAAIGDSENLVFVSAATAWEISVKRAKGKLDAPGEIEEWLRANEFIELPIEIGHAARAGELPPHHSDPFDRMLVAQAEIEGHTIVTADAEIVKYGIATLDASS
jgi:PIN domain nuclease of toxin-antitoxin system